MTLPPYPSTPQDGGQGAAVDNPYARLDPRDALHPPPAPRVHERAWPLRTWLVVIIVVLSGLGLAASSVAVSSIMREVTYSRVDEDLINSLGGWAKSSELFKSESSSRPPSDYVVIKLFEDGTSVVFNDPGELPQLSNVVVGRPPQSVTSAPGSDSGTRWRVIASREDGVTTVVAKNLAREQALLYGLALVQVIISVLVLAVLALLSYYVVRQAMAPLREVERTAGEIAAGDLDRRVPAWPRTTEVGQLAHALNTMIGQLQESVETAQSKEEQMRRFVGDASHELRTPLTSVRGYTELYRSGATDDVEMVFTRIDDESRRMSLLVEDLLALTRAEGSRLDLTPVDLLELSLSVASSARAAFPGREVSVSNETSSVPVVEGDASRLHQVLLNLISNGLTHGGPEAAVRVTLGLEDDDVLITVEDDGRGMSPETASHIFERFYREDASRSRASGGSGLGLAIVKSLVEKHGGTITVDSVEGEGSAFTVRLPRRKEQGE
ncbi:sensor histidine kinase [Corynebacterium marinum]|uniref:histidine kinase n=1 Tax=Corynebacterium marinum DSM 44953 TaxID=1224162 RepID=A0A0B6TP69_9CORY|nr:HAMP domain-containing sensor histidine kinase [Corynebacterium marinum]AJK69713.1 sensor kinase [Corynebacterium marinum DSM 44953]GGO18399.1 two-component sensor histidine kinase [Corynebacterium marinum]